MTEKQKTGRLIRSHKNGKLKTMAEIQKEFINVALRYNKNNITKTCKAIEMHRSDYYRKLYKPDRKKPIKNIMEENDN